MKKSRFSAGQKVIIKTNKYGFKKWRIVTVANGIKHKDKIGYYVDVIDDNGLTKRGYTKFLKEI